MAGYRSTGWQLKALEQHRLLRLQTGQHSSRILQTLRVSLPWPAVVAGGGLEAEGAELDLCWEPKQEPAVMVAHPVDQVVAAVRFVAQGVDVAVGEGTDRVVDEHIAPETCGEACCNRRGATAVDRGVGSASLRIARSFADDLGTQKSDQLSLDACACTACK